MGEADGGPAVPLVASLRAELAQAQQEVAQWQLVLKVCVWGGRGGICTA